MIKKKVVVFLRNKALYLMVIIATTLFSPSIGDGFSIRSPVGKSIRVEPRKGVVNEEPDADWQDNEGRVLHSITLIDEEAIGHIIHLADGTQWLAAGAIIDHGTRRTQPLPNTIEDWLPGDSIKLSVVPGETAFQGFGWFKMKNQINGEVIWVVGMDDLYTENSFQILTISRINRSSEKITLSDGTVLKTGNAIPFNALGYRYDSIHYARSSRYNSDFDQLPYWIVPSELHPFLVEKSPSSLSDWQEGDVVYLLYGYDQASGNYVLWNLDRDSMLDSLEKEQEDVKEESSWWFW